MDEEVTAEQANVYSTGYLTVRQDADFVRKRPAMYFGDTNVSGLHYLAEELINNAVREVRLGHCRRLGVEILGSGGLRVRDGGQGISVDCLPGQDKHVLECLLTQYLPATPFESRRWPAGGLHRLGLVSVCALSRRLVVEVCRDGFRWRQSFARGHATTPLRKLGPTTKTGTTVTVWPDAQIFSCLDFEFIRPRRRLEELAMLLPEMQVRLIDRRVDPPCQETVHSPEGLVAAQRRLGLGLHPVHPTVLRGEIEQDGIKAQVAFRWHCASDQRLYSLANGYTTEYHGTHARGFLRGLNPALRRALASVASDLLGQTALTSRRLRSGLVAVVAADLPDPLFSGATRGTLYSEEIVPNMRQLTRQVIESFARDHPDEIRAVARHLLSPPTIDPKSGMPT